MSFLTEGPADTGNGLLGEFVAVAAHVLGDVRLLDTSFFDTLEELLREADGQETISGQPRGLSLDELVKLSPTAALRTEVVDAESTDPDVHPHTAGGHLESLRINTKTIDAIAETGEDLHIPPAIRLADRVSVFPPVAEAVGKVRDDKYLEIEGGNILGDDQVRVHLFSPIVGIFVSDLLLQPL